MTEGDEVLRAIRTRRVVRNMTTEPADPQKVDEVVKAARYAPNAGNRRLQPVIAVTDPRRLRLLRAVGPGMIARPTAAAVICIDRGRAMDFGLAPDSPGLYIDVGTTAATMLLAAHAVGLAACPVTSFSEVAVGRILGLTDNVTAVMIICLGHPASVQPPAFPAPLPEA